MNWVGGARSRVKQSKERKIQKEFFERQKLVKKVNIHKQLSPKRHRKPISLDLLSLQTINQTHQGENGVKKQPVKIVLGDRSNLLSRRQEDLELPMSPIRNPSNLSFLDGRTESQTRHVLHQLHKHNDHEKQTTSPKLLLPVSDNNQGKLFSEYSNTDISSLPSNSSSNNRRDISKSQLSAGSLLLPFHGQPPQLESIKHNKRLPIPKKDLLAFQRAEKEKYMSSRPLAKQLPHQANGTSYIPKPKLIDNSTIDDAESPTVTNIPSKSAATCVVDSSERNASNDSMSVADLEERVLLGLDYEKQQSLCDTASDYAVQFKKAKISSFEEMINNYERPSTSNSWSKPVVGSNQEAWRRFTHEKLSPNDDTCKVPDITMEPPADRKANLFFKQKLSKKQIASMKRPPTVLQELLCLDDDLNDSDLFQTQDFTFEDVLAVDYEEPLKQQFEQHTMKFRGINQATANDENSIFNNSTHDNDNNSIEEMKISDKQVQLPKGKYSSNCRSVGVQCSKADNLHDMETQTDQHPLMSHSSTQSDTVQLVDAAVQSVMISNSSTMTQTSPLLNDKCLDDHKQLANHSDDLAVAQSIIVWQSLMIKILEINANTTS